VGEAKQWPGNVAFHGARAEEMTPERVVALLGGAADAVVCAYVIRNLPESGVSLASVGGLLRPGGRIARPECPGGDSRPARGVWNTLCWGVIIPAGRALTGRADLFRHLWRSVLEFDGRTALLSRMRAAGLESVADAPLPGWRYGITHTFVGRRPLEGGDER